ncbi:MAG: hypothetical protein NTZ09_10170 [Candidatus Hydrogenedentes bacterium]|nr:hypothetical protein [Candidatus Hydrogenedentota bacterium]
MGRTSVVAAIVVLAGSAMAYVGQTDSPAAPLDTVGPTVASATVRTDRTIEVQFSEPMLEPGVMNSANYMISGEGAGTMAANPSTVSGAGPYTLSWDSGEMLGRMPLTVTVTDVQDTVGNAITSPNSADSTGINMPLAWWPMAVVLGLAGTARASWRGRR